MGSDRKVYKDSWSIVEISFLVIFRIGLLFVYVGSKAGCIFFFA